MTHPQINVFPQPRRKSKKRKEKAGQQLTWTKVNAAVHRSDPHRVECIFFNL